MPRATSPFTRGIIISNKESGKTINECYNQLSLIKEKQKVSEVCSLDTIRRIYKSWDEQNPQIEPQYQNCGRKKKYDEQQESQIVNSVKKQPSQSLRKLEQNTDDNPSNLSYSTIRNILKDNNLNAYRIPTIQRITEPQKQKRLQFARDVRRWTNKWKSILFTDEVILKQGKIGSKFLCPIERVWSYLKDEMNTLKEDLDEASLFKFLQNAFLNSKKIKLAINRMYQSFPEKISKVITLKGNQIID
ncbi:hypothetical protein ABPG72_014014 [Tetrahymena utriculariae]